MSGKKHYAGWCMWALGASFFFAEYFARVSPSVMVDELMMRYHITALGVGSMSAVFLHAYIAMQLPVGLFIDQYGPKRLLSVMAGICALGCYLFAFADSLFAGQVARFLMGFGAAFAFVGTLKIAMMWLPRNRFAFITGLTQAIGMFGAAFGEGPLKNIVSTIGWKHTMLSIATVLAILSVLIALFVKDTGAHHEVTVDEISKASRKLFHGLIEVMRNRGSWVNALFVGTLYGPACAFGELWGVSYLHHTHHVSEQFAASSVSMLFLGLGVGGPITGWLSDHLGTRVKVMRWSAISSLIVLLCIFYLPIEGLTIPTLCFLYGLVNTGLGVTYAHAGELNRVAIGATAIAFANMASVLLGSIYQPLLGWLMEVHWLSHGHAQGGVHVYSAADYQYAVFILPLSMLVAIGTSFFLKDKQA